jgi:hypothetical protein
MLPETSVDVAAFVADLEKRLAADEEEYKCYVCYDPFANAPLKCSHRLCPGCFEQLKCCPKCWHPSCEDEAVFANFDAFIWRRAVRPNFYNICLHSGRAHNPSALLEVFLLTGSRFHGHTVDASGLITIHQWEDVSLAIEIIHRHTAYENATAANSERRELVLHGWLDKDPVLLSRRVMY